MLRAPLSFALTTHLKTAYPARKRSVARDIRSPFPRDSTSPLGALSGRERRRGPVRGPPAGCRKRARSPGLLPGTLNRQSVRALSRILLRRWSAAGRDQGRHRRQEPSCPPEGRRRQAEEEAPSPQKEPRRRRSAQRGPSMVSESGEGIGAARRLKETVPGLLDG